MTSPRERERMKKKNDRKAISQVKKTDTRTNIKHTHTETDFYLTQTLRMSVKQRSPTSAEK